MTTASIYRDGDDYTLYVVGHAGYAKHGQDIVCAGISTLCYTLIEFVSQEDQSSEITVDDDSIRVQCTATDDTRYRVQAAYDFAEIGLRLLEQEYPSNIVVNG